MKRIVLFILLISGTFICHGQTFTLEECQELAQKNYPAISQRGLIEKLAEFNISNARRNWLPQVSLSAQATYQSEVPTFPKVFTDLSSQLGVHFDGLPKDQYKAAIQVDQVIWDGGLIKAQVEAARAEGEVSYKNWESEMYAVGERVNQLYFGSLLLQENLRTADLLIEELERNYKMIESMVQFGTADKNDLDLMRVEILGARQQRSDLAATKRAYMSMLSLMTASEIGDSATLVKPDPITRAVSSEIARPELAAFDAQLNLLAAQRKAINASVMPQIGAFIQGAYANPGLDMFGSMIKNEWSPYFIAGVKLQWNLGGFYTKKNRLSQIELNSNRVNLLRETFTYNINLKSAQERIAADKMEEVMRYDNEIIALRRSIRERTEVLVNNGEASINDLLRDINAEDRARQNKSAHEVEWLKNSYDLKYTLNE